MIPLTSSNHMASSSSPNTTGTTISSKQTCLTPTSVVPPPCTSTMATMVTTATATTAAAATAALAIAPKIKMINGVLEPTNVAPPCLSAHNRKQSEAEEAIYVFDHLVQDLSVLETDHHHHHHNDVNVKSNTTTATTTTSSTSNSNVTVNCKRNKSANHNHNRINSKHNFNVITSRPQKFRRNKIKSFIEFDDNDYYDEDDTDDDDDDDNDDGGGGGGGEKWRNTTNGGKNFSKHSTNYRHARGSGKKMINMMGRSLDHSYYLGDDELANVFTQKTECDSTMKSSITTNSTENISNMISTSTSSSTSTLTSTKVPTNSNRTTTVASAPPTTPTVSNIIASAGSLTDSMMALNLLFPTTTQPSSQQSSFSVSGKNDKITTTDVVEKNVNENKQTIQYDNCQDDENNSIEWNQFQDCHSTQLFTTAASLVQSPSTTIITTTTSTTNAVTVKTTSAASSFVTPTPAKYDTSSPEIDDDDDESVGIVDDSDEVLFSQLDASSSNNSDVDSNRKNCENIKETNQTNINDDTIATTVGTKIETKCQNDDDDDANVNADDEQEEEEEEEREKNVVEDDDNDYGDDENDCDFEDEPSQLLYDRLQQMEQEQELLNNSLLALTSHFAQVQLRLRQIVEAKDVSVEKRETLLKELENFANRGIPELMIDGGRSLCGGGANGGSNAHVRSNLERSVSMATSLMADDVFEDDDDDNDGGGGSGGDGNGNEPDAYIEGDGADESMMDDQAKMKQNRICNSSQQQTLSNNSKWNTGTKFDSQSSYDANTDTTTITTIGDAIGGGGDASGARSLAGSSTRLRHESCSTSATGTTTNTANLHHHHQWITEEKLERQRTRQKVLISQLKEQLEDLERYAYETGEMNHLPSSMLLERQNAIIEQLRCKLPVLTIDEIDKLSPEELRNKVDHAVKELVNPVLMKEQLVTQLKTQVSDLERFIEFLQQGPNHKQRLIEALNADGTINLESLSRTLGANIKQQQQKDSKSKLSKLSKFLILKRNNSAASKNTKREATKSDDKHQQKSSKSSNKTGNNGQNDVAKIDVEQSESRCVEQKIHRSTLTSSTGSIDGEKSTNLDKHSKSVKGGGNDNYIVNNNSSKNSSSYKSSKSNATPTTNNQQAINIMHRIMSLLHVFTWTHFGSCGSSHGPSMNHPTDGTNNEPFSADDGGGGGRCTTSANINPATVTNFKKNELKKHTKHFGDLRAVLEIKIDTIMQYHRAHFRQQPESQSHISSPSPLSPPPPPLDDVTIARLDSLSKPPSTKDPYKVYETLTMLVRKELAIALRDLFQHGLRGAADYEDYGSMVITGGGDGGTITNVPSIMNAMLKPVSRYGRYQQRQIVAAQPSTKSMSCSRTLQMINDFTTTMQPNGKNALMSSSSSASSSSYQALPKSISSGALNSSNNIIGSLRAPSIFNLGLGCFGLSAGIPAFVSNGANSSGKSGGGIKRNHPMHAWEVILYYYDLKNGNKFRSAPTRRLSKSFGLQVLNESSIHPKHSLLAAIDDIIDTHTRLKRSLDLHFKTFVCMGLNQHMLGQWLRLIVRNQTLVNDCYEKWSYTAITGFEDALRQLDKLSSLNFSLPINVSIRQLQSINDAF